MSCVLDFFPRCDEIPVFSRWHAVGEGIAMGFSVECLCNVKNPVLNPLGKLTLRGITDEYDHILGDIIQQQWRSEVSW